MGERFVKRVLWPVVQPLVVLFQDHEVYGVAPQVPGTRCPCSCERTQDSVEARTAQQQRAARTWTWAFRGLDRPRILVLRSWDLERLTSDSVALSPPTSLTWWAVMTAAGLFLDARDLARASWFFEKSRFKSFLTGVISSI